MSKPNNLANKRLTTSFVRNVSQKPAALIKKRMTVNQSLLTIKKKEHDKTQPLIEEKSQDLSLLAESK